MQQVFRPAFGRVLTVFIATICAAGAIATVVDAGPSALLDYGPWLALAAGSCWAAFWRPCVEVSDGGVRLVNVTRTIDVPWPAITAIDTHWALALKTAYGKYAAWAAPTNDRGVARKAMLAESRASRHGVTHGHRVLVSESATNPAGEAASLIRRRWDELRLAGHLDDPRLEHDRIPVTWHIATVAGGLGLIALGIVGVVI